ncbi:hypothetical protein M9Y10_021666 [Tritrichomonas musculus]|uniref:NET domain-containing protein n=1 Tax=Tritrichomonas musculus TaxID=1915356 RepID=A0ABR2KQ71_9EUKA
MDTPLCSLCCIYFQRALNSPVGEAVSSYIRLFNPPLIDQYNLLSIYDKLKKNSYSSPEEWLNDLDKNIEQSLRFFGIDSEMSIALLSIQQNIRESTRHLLCGNNENWYKSRQKMISSLESYLSNMPNNEVSFRQFVDQPLEQAPMVAKPFIPSALTIQNEKIDLNELKVRIQSLPTDEDHQNVMKIVSHYEPEYANASGITQCDLRHCQPYTLHLLKEYVKKHAPPLPKPLPSAAALSSLSDLISTSSLTPQKMINPAAIPRMKSTPLPPSPNDSKRPPPLIAETKPSILSNSSFAQPLSAKPSNTNPNSSASQNLHSSLQAAATNQALAKNLSQASPQMSAISVISAALGSVLVNSSNSSFASHPIGSPISPSSLKPPNSSSTIASTSPFLKINSPTPSAGDSDENGIFDSISPSSSRSEGFDHENEDENQSQNKNE